MSDLFKKAGIIDNASTVIFYSSDGYSTSLDLNYLLQNNIILAYKLNDVTLPPDRGFPLQLVAESKYGINGQNGSQELKQVTTHLIEDIGRRMDIIIRLM